MAERGVLFGLALLAALVTLLALAGHSQARCGTTCLGLKLQALQRQLLPSRVRALESRLEEQDRYITWLEDRATRLEAKAAEQKAKLAALQGCMGEVPISRYGEEIGPSGYLFRLETPEETTLLATTALDVTYPNDPVGAWIFANTCNKEGIEATQRYGPVRQSTVPTTHFDGS